MNISEMVQLLLTEQAVKGDREVKLHGHYGAESSTFEVMPDENVLPEDRDKLNIWTDIMTG